MSVQLSERLALELQGCQDQRHISQWPTHQSDASNALQVAPFTCHKIEPPSRTVETTLGQLAKIYQSMYQVRAAPRFHAVPGVPPSCGTRSPGPVWLQMRRMEVASDMQYKAKLIRGFCHLCVLATATPRPHPCPTLYLYCLLFTGMMGKRRCWAASRRR